MVDDLLNFDHVVHRHVDNPLDLHFYDLWDLDAELD